MKFIFSTGLYDFTREYRDGALLFFDEKQKLVTTEHTPLPMGAAVYRSPSISTPDLQITVDDTVDVYSGVAAGMLAFLRVARVELAKTLAILNARLTTIDAILVESPCVLLCGEQASRLADYFPFIVEP